MTKSNEPQVAESEIQQWERWDRATYDRLYAETESAFKVLREQHPPETLPTRDLRNEWNAVRSAYIKEIGEGATFKDLSRARQAINAFTTWMEAFRVRVTDEIRRTQCRHGNDRATCFECANEADYLQAVREQRR
jgi:hypothetical protein